jgi:hypothetical protein
MSLFNYKITPLYILPAACIDASVTMHVIRRDLVQIGVCGIISCRAIQCTVFVWNLRKCVLEVSNLREFYDIPY